MPRLFSGRSTDRPSHGERVFADEVGRLWSAAHVGSAIVFVCITDGRQSDRALAMELPALDAAVEDDQLRAWLTAAPRIGTLT